MRSRAHIVPRRRVAVAGAHALVVGQLAAARGEFLGRDARLAGQLAIATAREGCGVVERLVAVKLADTFATLAALAAALDRRLLVGVSRAMQGPLTVRRHWLLQQITETVTLIKNEGPLYVVEPEVAARINGLRLRVAELLEDVRDARGGGSG